MKINWTYEEDYILLDESLTEEDRKKIFLGKRPRIRLRLLKGFKLNQGKLDREKNQIIDIYPDYNMVQIAKHLHRTDHYIVKRVHELKQKGLLRDKSILSKQQKNYIVHHRGNRRATSMAEDLELPIYLVKMVISEEYRKEQKVIDKQEEEIRTKDKMPKKMILCERNRPENALDKRIIRQKVYKENVLYEIITSPGTKTEEVFRGTLIYQNMEFILLKHKLGYKESFQKVDFETGEKSIKEVVR